MPPARPVLTITATDDPATGQARLRLVATGAEAWGERRVIVALDGLELLRATPGTEPVSEAVVDCRRLLGLDHYRLRFCDDAGLDLADAADWVLRGDVFAALAVGPGDVLDRAQLHHSRFASLFLVEIAARSFFLRHPGASFALRGAALTILGHRLLERLPGGLDAADVARLAWLLDQAGALLPEGEGLIRAAAPGQAPDWQDVRWTVSLATVAGHLALHDEDYDRALLMLGTATRQTRHVGVARVSALNLVICAFAEGLVALLLDRPDQARRALRGGVEAVKPIVAAQELFENVWVLGDLENVLAGARQCLIALIRTGLYVAPPGAPPGAPVIDPPTQISTFHVRSPLGGMLKAGLAPRLARLVREHGGR